MYRWVTRAVGPLAAMAAVTAATAGAQAGSAAPVGQWSASRTTPCPVDVAPPVSASPGASPSDAAENPPSLKLALTARGTRTSAGDIVDYRITASPARTPLHDVTVTARLTCVPGDAWLAGRPSASTGRATAGPRAVTWHFDLGRTPATADFAIRVRPGARGGPMVGEVTAAGPVSNCPELRAADTGVDTYCRVTVLVPATAPQAAPGHPARPAPVAPGSRPPALPSVQAAPVPFPVMPPVPPAKTGPGAAGALPVVPGASPSASPTVLSQLDRPPVVPTTPAGPEAVTQDPVPPGTTLRSDTSRADLSGRAFAFLIGGVAFLLIATAIAGSLIGARLRRNADDDTDTNTNTGPRIAPRPRTSGDGPRRADIPRPGHDGPRELTRPADAPAPRPAHTPSTLPDVVRRTAEAGDPPPRPRLGTDPTLSYDRPASRAVVDE